MGYLLWSVRMLLFPKVEGFENSVEKFFSWAADLREILDGTSEGEVLCPPGTVFGKSIPPAN